MQQEWFNWSTIMVSGYHVQTKVEILQPQLIGASVSKSHIDEFAAVYVCMFISYVLP